ncbi:carbon-nitrogen hydrolase [Globomyces pollinis-pini]|nr:carbon-nitrogen hydrolase [Globomyces pollinis-pini]
MVKIFMLVAVAQIRSSNIIKENLIQCLTIINEASLKGVKCIFFPEASDYIAENSSQAVELAQSLNGDFVKELQSSAIKNNMMISIGIHEKSSELHRLFNSHILIDEFGKILDVYRKIHLFDIELSDGPNLKESNTTIPGPKVGSPISTSIGKIGLGLCYDLRFPEFSTLLQMQGMDIMTYPSAFTVPTGQAHWEVLLRARAIETQSYVVAAAQVGQNTSKRSTYGHAMAVDPWGKIIADCGGENWPTFKTFDIDLNQVFHIKQQMPVQQHRRHDLYNLNTLPNK